MKDIATGVILVQTRQVVPHPDALVEGGELWTVKDPKEFRLAHEDHLKELSVQLLEVGEHEHLLEERERQPMGLIDEQNHSLAARVQLQ
jgi:hypothetical protein